MLSGSCQNKTTTDKWGKSELLFSDEGTGGWQNKWMLDGLQSQVSNTVQGMELHAGMTYGNDSSHTVLWTKEVFEGNIAIEYDFTRLDTSSCCVNILYFHAEGKGTADYPQDLSLWNDKRTVPHMYTYFKNLNTYHISYSAFTQKYTEGGDYIRMRRYNPNGKGLKGTDIEGDHFDTGLFKTGQTYHIQVIFLDGHTRMTIQNVDDPSDKITCKWDVSDQPLYTSGRIGLRQMYTRKSRYKDFKVWSIK